MSMESDEPLVDEDGDLLPKSKSAKHAALRLQLDLKKARRKTKNNQKYKSKQRIDAKNAEVKRELLIQASDFVSNRTNIIEPTVRQEIENFYPEIAETKKIGWEPFPGPQTEFLAADEFEVLFSGGRAPGKSDALLIDPLRYCDFKSFRGLMIRKAMQDLRDLIRRAKELYPLAYPGTKWKEQEKLFVFPSGATIEFGYCDHEDDVGRYQGQEYSWLGIDELTQIEREEIYEKLIASVRKSGTKNYIRCTTNPNGPGKMWVKRRFVDRGPMGASINIETHIEKLGITVNRTRKWIHGTVFDNPKIVAENPEYIAYLQTIDNAVLRKQWLEGDWDSADGLAFDEFDRNVHIIKPFEIPEHWYKFRGCDWGFKSKAVCLWMTVDYDGNVYVYREMTTTGVLAKDFGTRIAKIEEDAKERIRYGILDASAWSQRGENAPSPADDMPGLGWRPSDRTKHSRLTGKMQVHNYLQKDTETGKPKVYFFDTCTDLISCISSLPISTKDPEDVKDDGDDHAYDALRYGLMSRPRLNNNYFFANQQSEPEPPLDPTFGY